MEVIKMHPKFSFRWFEVPTEESGILYSASSTHWCGVVYSSYPSLRVEASLSVTFFPFSFLALFLPCPSYYWVFLFSSFALFAVGDYGGGGVNFEQSFFPSHQDTFLQHFLRDHLSNHQLSPV